MNVSFYTLGCKVNQFETEGMIEILQKEGFNVIKPSNATDVFIINTCAVTGESERKSRQVIKKCKKINEKAIIVAVGCSTQINSEKILKETPVDIIIGTKNKDNIAHYIKKKINEQDRIIEVDNFNKFEEFEELKISNVHDRTRANIKIQDGCRQYCSYCIIPYTRGPIRSRKIENIFEEVKRLAVNNYKEVVLNGIHISSYGKDLKNLVSLADVIEGIEQINGIQRIRLGSLEPRIITDEFMSKISRCSKLCDHFHLSLQSGSDTVLKRMNRKYSTNEYEEKVNIIRKYYPLSGITTDIIVGFPQETEDEFNETYDFVKKIKFSKIHVFRFSPREGTEAAKYKGQVDGQIKNVRSKKLLQLGNDISQQFMKSFINKNIEVLFEVKKDNNYYEGYTTNYLKVLYKSDNNIENKVLNLRVKDVYQDHLIV